MLWLEFSNAALPEMDLIAKNDCPVKNLTHSSFDPIFWNLLKI